MIELPNESNSTQYGSGQASGTPAELLIGVQNEGFGHFVKGGPSWWVIPPMRVWALLREESHSSPERG